MARTAPVPNIPPIPGMCPGIAALAGNGDGGGGSGGSGKKGKGKDGAGTGNGEEDASGDGKNGGEACGDPVCPITGRMMLDLYDFGFAAPLTFAWVRAYNSRTSDVGSDLGHGWAHPLGWRILSRRGRVTVFDEAAKKQLFADVPEGGEWAQNGLGWQLRRAGTSYELLLPDGRHLHFGPLAGKFHWLVAVSDRNGNRISIDRDPQGRILGVIDAAGRPYRFELDPAGHITAIHVASDAAHRSWLQVAQYTYDSSGNLTSFTDAEGFCWRYAYRGHLLVQHQLPTGLSYCYRYDGTTHEAACVESWGEYIGKIDPALEVPIPPAPSHGRDRRRIKGIHYVRFEYMKDLRYSEVSNALGALMRYFGDESGRVIKRVDEHGGTSEYFYDPQTGALLRETQPDGSERIAPDGDRDPEMSLASDGSKNIAFDDEDGTHIVFDTETGMVTSRAYDTRGNLIYVQHADGSTEQYDYDERGLLRFGVDRAAVITQYAYDAQGCRTESVRAGVVDRFEYDYLGRLTAHVDPRGNRTEWVWDGRSEVIEKRLADGSVLRWQRDAMRNATWLDDRGRITRVEYGGLDWPYRVELADGAVWEYRYDLLGNVVSIRNPLGQVARQTFDHANRQIGFTSFEGWSHTAGYDHANRLIWKETPTGRQVFVFDEHGKLEGVEMPDGSTVAMEYEPAARIVRVDNGVLVEREKNRVGNVVREIQSTHQLQVHWQGANPDAFVSDVGVPILRHRDRAGMLASIQAGPDVAVRIEPSSNGELLELGPSLVLRRTFDAFGQLTSQCLAKLDRNLPRDHQATSADPGVLWWSTHEWQGTRLVEERFSDGRSVTYTLDAADRITTRRVHRDGVQVEEEIIHYDAIGTPRVAGARYDALARPVEIEGESLEYDDAGRLAKRTSDRGETTYEWSPDGELIAVHAPDKITRFRYDAYGRRTGKRVYRQREIVKDVSYVWTNNCILHEVDHTQNRTRTYLRDESSFAPLGHVDLRSGVAQTIYYLRTPIGFPVLAVDAAGNEVWRADPTTFGDARASASDVDARFPNQHADDDIGLVYNFRRWYDPKLGLFISPDPELFDGNPHPRQYASNPTVEADPLGLKKPKLPNMKPTGTGLLKPGPFAKQGTADCPGFIDAGSNAQNHNFSDSTKRAIDNAGFKYGCHSCGSKDPDPGGKQPKLKHFVPDHQPPVNSTEHMTAAEVAGGVRLYPHCRRCSNKQSQQAKNSKKKGTNKDKGEKQVAQQQKSKTQPHPKPDNATLQAQSDDLKANQTAPKNGWPNGF